MNYYVSAGEREGPGLECSGGVEGTGKLINIYHYEQDADQRAINT